jgi:hypothetical protein
MTQCQKGRMGVKEARWRKEEARGGGWDLGMEGRGGGVRWGHEGTWRLEGLKQ